jgi:hypothetical protein
LGLLDRFAERHRVQRPPQLLVAFATGLRAEVVTEGKGGAEHDLGSDSHISVIPESPANMPEGD